jgi:hypothetical protein
MGLLAFVFRAILFLIVFRLAGMVLRAFFGGFAQGARPAASSGTGRGPAATPRGQVEELVRDPVCGVHTARSSALVGSHQGREAYFCSEECRAKAAT